YEGLLRASNTRIAHYRSKIAELRNEISKVVPNASAKLAQLDQDISFSESEYTAAKEKLNTVSDDGGLNNFKQTLFGQPAIEPEPARKMVIFGLSGASAIVLSSL